MGPRRRASETVAAVLARHKSADLRFATASHHPRYAEAVALSVTGRDMLNELRLWRLPGLPEELLRLAASQGDHRVAAVLAGRPDLPEDLLVALRDSNETDVKREIAKNSTVSSEHLGRLDLTDKSTRLALARRDDLPADMYRALSEYDDAHNLLATNSSCPPDVLRHVSQAGYGYGWGVARNDAAPRDVIEGLIPRVYSSLLAEIARHRTTGHLVARFMRHRDSTVRAAVASRDDVAGSVLDHLSADRSMTVRVAAASHRELPADARAKLARSRSADVLASLLRNPSLSDVEYDAVLRRGISEVAVAACAMERTTPAQWEFLSEIDDERVEVAVAASRHTPRQILRRIAEQGSVRAVEEMVRRRDAPAEAVRRMAQSSARVWRLSAARSPAADAGTLAALAGAGDMEVVVAALRHERMPDYVLAAWARRSGSQQVLFALAANPRADDVDASADLTLEQSPPPRVAAPDAEALARGMDPVAAALAAAAVDASAPPARDDKELQSIAHRLMLAAASVEDTAADVLGVIAARSGLHNATLRVSAAANPSTPEDALCDLAKGSRQEKSAVASNPSATAKVLSTLRNDWSSNLMYKVTGAELAALAATVACHPAADEATRREILLAETSDGAAARDAVAANPSAPSAALAMLGEHVAADCLSRSMSSGDIDHVLRILHHPSCPPMLAECVATAAAEIAANAQALLDAVDVRVAGHADIGAAETSIVDGESAEAAIGGGFGL